MREIKFNVFYQGKMRPVDALRWKDNGMVVNVPDDDGFPHDITPEIPISLSLLQYTGLKDKNGKEIYEGDILYGNEDENDTVVYEENKFILQPLGDDSIFWEKSEVIGNIYENKELLND